MILIRFCSSLSGIVQHPLQASKRVFFLVRKTEEGLAPCVRSTCRCRPCWLPLDSGRGRCSRLWKFQGSRLPADARPRGRPGTTAPVRYGWEHDCCWLAGWQLGIAAVPVFFWQERRARRRHESYVERPFVSTRFAVTCGARRGPAVGRVRLQGLN